MHFLQFFPVVQHHNLYAWHFYTFRSRTFIDCIISFNFFHSNMALEFNEIRMSIKSARGIYTDSCTRIWVALRGTRFTPPHNHRLICLLCHHRKDCMSSCFTTLALQPFSSIGYNKVWGRFQPRRKSNGIAVRTASVHVLIPPSYWSGSWSWM